MYRWIGLGQLFGFGLALHTSGIDFRGRPVTGARQDFLPGLLPFGRPVLIVGTADSDAPSA